MNKLLKNFVAITVASVQIFLPFLQTKQYEIAYAEENKITAQVVDEYGEAEDITFTIPTDEEIEETESGDDDGIMTTPEQETAYSTDSDSSDNRIVFNPTDQNYIKKYALLSSLTPNLMFDVDELATLSGKSTDELDVMHWNNFEQYQKLAEQYQKTINNEYLRNKAMTMPSVLVKILGLSSETQAEQEVLNNKQKVSNAIDDILSKKIDSRIIETLNYLVRDKDDPRGGAGHWRIKVSRIFKNYSRQWDQNSRESNQVVLDNKENTTVTSSTEQAQEDTTVSALTTTTDLTSLEQTAENLGVDTSSSLVSGEVIDQNGQTVSDFLVSSDDSESNISSHFKGQAVDISEIDDIRCTKIERKRIGSDKKTAQAPYNIQLAWQTREGYAANSSDVNSSFNKMMLNMGREAMLDMLSDMNIDFENMDKLEANNFSDIATTIGQAFFTQILNSSEGSIWNFKLSDTLRKLGGVILADGLNLSRKPFLDTNLSSIDAIEEAIGRSDIETSLELPYGSLKGNSRDEMFINIGKYRLLDELGLPLDVLDNNPSNSEDLLQRIGSRIIEDDLGLNKGSFYNKNSLKEIENAAGKTKIQAIFSMPDAIDSRYSITTGSGRKLKSNAISPANFNRLVAMSHLITTAYQYGDYDPYSDTSQSVTVNINNVSQINWRDQMFNVPEGKIDKFLSGLCADDDYKEIGIFTLVRTLESNDTGQARLTKWFNSPNESFTVFDPSANSSSSGKSKAKDVTLPIDNYVEITGLVKADLYNLLGNSDKKQAKGVFSRHGKKTLTQAIKTSSVVQTQVRNTINSSPSLSQDIATYEFYKRRVDNIATLRDSINQTSDSLSKEIDKLDDSLYSPGDKKELKDAMAAFKDSISTDADANNSQGVSAYSNLALTRSNTLIGHLTSLSDKSAQYPERFANVNTLKNRLSTDLDSLAKNLYEMLTGDEQNDYNQGEITINNLGNKQIELAGVKVGALEVSLFLAGKVTPEEFLMTIGSAKIADELNLPTKAMKYAAKILAKDGNAGGDRKNLFYRAIGLAALERKASDKGHSSGLGSNTQELSNTSTIKQLRDQLASSMDNNIIAANKVIADGMGLGEYNLEYLMNGDFAAWSVARSKAEANDRENKMTIGTTENFVRGTPLERIENSLISDDEIRQMATALYVSESSLRAFIALSNGVENPAINNIYYVDKNKYLAPQDSDTSCGEKAVPDDAYLYYDQDGLHSFTTYAEANEYQKNHQDRQYKSPLEEIANALNSSRNIDPSYETLLLDSFDTLSSSDSILTMLNNYISKNSSSVFNTEVLGGSYSDNEKMSTILNYTRGVPETLYNKFFTRSGSGSGSPDYLASLGKAMIDDLAVSYVGESLNMTLGSSKITADDIYEIFDGNSKSVFSKIGSNILGEELEVDADTFNQLFTANSNAARKCTISQMASQIIGNYLNMPGLDLGSLTSGNMGRSRIEALLSFPKGSFRGASISELLDTSRNNYVSIVDFYLAFSLPATDVALSQADASLAAMGADYVKTYKNKSFAEKMKIIQNYVSSIGYQKLSSLNSILLADWANIIISLNVALPLLTTEDMLDRRTADGLIALQNSGLFKSYDDSKLAEALVACRNRLSSTDSALSLDKGTTVDLLLGVITPDDYSNKVKDDLTGRFSFDLVKNIFHIDTKVTYDDLNNFKNSIRNAGSGGIDPNALANIYSFLNKAFSLKFDEKLGLEPGTIAGIITKPAQAPSEILKVGAKKLDAKLGIEDKTFNFSYFADIYSGDPEKDQDLCQSSYQNASQGFTECMSNSSKRVNAASRMVVEDYVAKNISEHLTEATGLKINVVTAFGQQQQNNYGAVTLTSDQIKGIFKGDLRAVEVIVTVGALGSIFGDENGNYALGNNSSGFLLTPQDIVYAYYGDPDTEAYAQQRAMERYYAEINDKNADLWLNQDISEDTQRIANVNSTPGAMSGAMGLQVSGDSRNFSINYADNEYAVPQGADVTPPSAPVDPLTPMPDQRDYTLPQTGEVDYNAYQAALDSYNQTQRNYQRELNDYNYTVNQANLAGAEAAAADRKIKRQLMEYKFSDAMLRKVDKNIPAGFTWNMMKGNGYLRTSTLLNYIENWMRNDEEGNSGWAKYLPPGSLPAIYSYFSGPLRGDLDALINSTTGNILNMVDSYLTENAPNILKTSMRNGTAQALFAFLKNGNASDPLMIGGQEYSLKGIYGDATNFIANTIGNWADKKFGFPAGSTYGIYKAYNDFKAAKGSLNIIRGIGTIKEGTYLNQNISGITGLPSSGQIVKSPEGVTHIVGGDGKIVVDGKGNPVTLSQDQLDDANSKVTGTGNETKQKMTNLKAEIVSAIITAVFSDQIASAEESLGLVPGTGAIAVGMLTAYLMGAAFNPVAAISFVLINLFGVYRVDLVCTADGYYPSKTARPDPAKTDVAGLGVFDGLNDNTRQQKFIEAAQYKADRLALDLYEMPARTGNSKLVPMQVMTGRIETVETAAPLVVDTACKAIGVSSMGKGSDGTQTAVCSGSRVGIWRNPQTTAYTHIGF